MVKKTLVLSQDRMRHETVADYFPVLQQTMEDKNEEELSAGEEKIEFSDGINTIDSNDSNTNLNIRRTERTRRRKRRLIRTPME